MPKKPLYNAIIAAGYISVLVTFIDWATRTLHQAGESIYIPMLMLSLLVISVAIMGFLFFYEPLILFMDNKRGEAVKMFASTLGIFALIAIVFAILAL